VGEQECGGWVVGGQEGGVGGQEGEVGGAGGWGGGAGKTCQRFVTRGPERGEAQTAM
jgi:hypothetical protein